MNINHRQCGLVWINHLTGDPYSIFDISGHIPVSLLKCGGLRRAGEGCREASGGWENAHARLVTQVTIIG